MAVKSVSPKLLYLSATPVQRLAVSDRPLIIFAAKKEAGPRPASLTASVMPIMNEVR
jgi:hypothetical protein